MEHRNAHFIRSKEAKSLSLSGPFEKSYKLNVAKSANEFRLWLNCDTTNESPIFPTAIADC
jgi:hypothetical protein